MSCAKTIFPSFLLLVISVHGSPVAIVRVQIYAEESLWQQFLAKESNDERSAEESLLNYANYLISQVNIWATFLKPTSFKLQLVENKVNIFKTNPRRLLFVNRKGRTQASLWAFMRSLGRVPFRLADVRHLLSGRHIKGRLGMAHSSSACRNPTNAYAASLASSRERKWFSSASTMGHELGHTLGISHKVGNASCYSPYKHWGEAHCGRALMRHLNRTNTNCVLQDATGTQMISK